MHSSTTARTQASRARNFSFVQLVESWNKTEIGQVMVERVDFNMIENYGVVDLDGEETKPFQSITLKGLIEKPSPDKAPSNLALLGRYILPPRILEILENTKAGVGDEIQLTDAMDELLKLDGLNALLTDAEIHDCGTKQGFLSANMAVGMRDPETREEIKRLFQSSGW